MGFIQESVTRRVQHPYFRTTAFSQVGLFLHTPFSLKLLFPVTSASNLSKKKMSVKLHCFCYCIPFSTCHFPSLPVIELKMGRGHHNSMIAFRVRKLKGLHSGSKQQLYLNINFILKLHIVMKVIYKTN